MSNDTTIPAGLSLLQAECSLRIDRKTGMPIDYQKYVLVLVGEESGVVTPEHFKVIKEKWKKNPTSLNTAKNIHVIGHEKTFFGTIGELLTI